MKKSSAAQSFDNVYFEIPFKTFGIVTVSLPFFSLFFCFFSSISYKLSEVCETVCEASNFIPSISAVTGTSPERYVWRLCLALHSTPRFGVACMYYNFYMSRMGNVPQSWRGFYKRLAKWNFWTNVVENFCLLGVTYISNTDNYPVHEKIFVVFMFASCIYMLMTLILYRMSRDTTKPLPPLEAKSFRVKKYFFIAILLSTAGLLFFFYKHRVLCIPNAFSWFSLCEYLIAVTNMGFHFSAVYEFIDCKLVIGLPGLPEQNGERERNGDIPRPLAMGGGVNGKKTD